MKKISLRTRKLMTIILSLILVATTLLVSSKELSTVSALDGTPGEVTSLLSNIKVNITSISDGTQHVIDNVAVTGKPIYSGSYYAVRINWAIETSKYQNHVEAGDYFWLDISNNYFSFSNSFTENNLVYEGVTIGKWKIQENKIYCEFTDACTNYTQVSGYFEAEGELKTSNTGTCTITLGGIPIEIDVNTVTGDFPYENLPALSGGGSLIDKLGTHYKGNNYLSWNIYVNYANTIQAGMGNTPTTLENVIIKDTLPDDLILESADSVSIMTPVNNPKNTTQLTTRAACQIKLNDKFTIKNQSESQSITDWEQSIEDTALSYGISLDGKTFIANLGNLPGSLNLGTNSDDYKALLKSYNGLLTTAELNALANICYNNELGSYPVYGINIGLKTISNSTNKILQKESYDNSVTLTAKNSVSGTANDQLDVEKMDAGIEGTTPKTVILTKKDYDTNAIIPGASFKLQYLNGVVWEDYTPISGDTVRTTDNNGQVTFDNLGTGTYKFVEVSAADGYDISTVEYSYDTFTISSSDTTGHEITATNKVLPISISGSKTWADNNNAANKRPASITVNLMNGATTVISMTVTEADNWEYTFTNLPKYDASHNLINYTITEDAVENYQTTINGYDITNTYIPPETESSETEPQETTSTETTTEEPTSEETTTEEPTSEETTTEEPTAEELTSLEEETTENVTSKDHEQDELNGEIDKTEKSTESDKVTPVGTGDNTDGIIWLILTGLCACMILTFSCAKRKEHLDE